MCVWFMYMDYGKNENLEIIQFFWKGHKTVTKISNLFCYSVNIKTSVDFLFNFVAFLQCLNFTTYTLNSLIFDVTNKKILHHSLVFYVINKKNFPPYLLILICSFTREFRVFYQF